MNQSTENTTSQWGAQCGGSQSISTGHERPIDHQRTDILLAFKAQSRLIGTGSSYPHPVYSQSKLWPSHRKVRRLIPDVTSDPIGKDRSCACLQFSIATLPSYILNCAGSANRTFRRLVSVKRQAGMSRIHIPLYSLHFRTQLAASAMSAE